MASITEVKIAISKANAQSTQGAAALANSAAKLDEAITMLSRAADGTGHELIKEAQAALKKAKASIAEANKAIGRSQESSNRYAKSI